MSAVKAMRLSCPSAEPAGHGSGRQLEATDPGTMVEIALVGESGKEGLTATRC
jgi:hypothetical protein